MPLRQQGHTIKAKIKFNTENHRKMKKILALFSQRYNLLFSVKKQQKNMKHQAAQLQYLVPNILNIYQVFLTLKQNLLVWIIKSNKK